MKIRKGYRALVAEAEAEVRSLTPEQAQRRLGRPGVVLVDLRDVRELQREGRIPGSLHVPRGMLEFWIDPDSPYYRRDFDAAREIILYCNKGWRSALAARSLQAMGLEPVSHIQGGMDRWREDLGGIETLPPRKPA